VDTNFGRGNLDFFDYRESLDGCGEADGVLNVDACGGDGGLERGWGAIWEDCGCDNGCKCIKFEEAEMVADETTTALVDQTIQHPFEDKGWNFW
jgi:hypothetical protein